MMSRHSSICVAVSTNGGAKRMILPWVGLASKPFSFRAMQMSQAGTLCGVIDQNSIEQSFAPNTSDQIGLVHELFNPTPKSLSQLPCICVSFSSRITSRASIATLLASGFLQKWNHADPVGSLS